MDGIAACLREIHDENQALRGRFAGVPFRTISIFFILFTVIHSREFYVRALEPCRDRSSAFVMMIAIENRFKKKTICDYYFSTAP